ncbi:MAG: FAD-dependent monooxygenase [Pseudomonadota bacterium]|nr:FAD-dependent monooxygenase [Pseudomonadota bacterium]
MQTTDVVVAGAGPSALVAAALLARQGLSAAIVGPQPHPDSDPRTIALMQPSIRLLCHLGLWQGKLLDVAQPLRRLRLIDDTGGTLTAPAITFSAAELNLEEFGWNLPVAALTQALRELCFTSGVTHITGRIDGLAEAGGAVSVRCRGSDTELAARIIVAADGRDSFVRQALGIAADEWSYEQSAIATTFGHSAAHEDQSIEYHRPSGPLTTVPLPDQRCGLVWMEAPERAGELMALSDEEFACELQAAMHGHLGRIFAVGRRHAFAMRGLLASEFGGPRALLVGEAAHVLPPIGAQGLNMSFRDAATAAELIGEAHRKGGDPGSAEVVRRYGELRRRDVLPRQGLIHAMNQSLLSRLLPISALRALGMAAIDRFGPLRKVVMNEGLAPSQPLPLAMRPQGTTGGVLPDTQ